MMGGNRVARGSNYFSWDQFDALPPMVRTVINTAPVTLGTNRAWRALREGQAVEVVARYEIAVARRAIWALTEADYGPDHPQARRTAA